MATDPSKPLTGVRVLDLTNVLSGPYCCYQLALMGAEVIKIEKPGSGDLARQLGADEERSRNNMGVSFLAQNAGKKSVTLNLKSPRGVELLKELVTTADVLVENFRPGVMERLGVHYQVLKQHNAALIYCAISGFGQTGPLSQRPAYDQIIQGLSGVMAITGDEQSAPLRVGYPVADTMGGMAAAFAIASALHAKPRGCFIDLSMLESLVSSMGWVVSNLKIAGVVPAPQGNENMTAAPSGAFRTETGLLNIAANKEEQWRALVSHLCLDNLLDDQRFTTRALRKQNRIALVQLLEAALISKPAEIWEEELNAIGVPAGRVLHVEQVLSSEQFQSRNMFTTLSATEENEEIEVAVAPFLLNNKRPQPDSQPPGLGADNKAVYASLELSVQEIEELEKGGVI